MCCYFLCKQNGSSIRFASSSSLSRRIVFASPSAAMCPWDSRITLWHVSRIISRSWDAMSFVWGSRLMVFMTVRRLQGSRAVEGSSMTTISGSIAKMVAMAALRFSPPDSLWLCRYFSYSRCKSRRTRSTRFSASSLDRP